MVSLYRQNTIFTKYGANENDLDADGNLPSDDSVDDEMAAETKVAYKSSHTRDKLDEFITDYNKLYGTGFSTIRSTHWQPRQAINMLNIAK